MQLCANVCYCLPGSFHGFLSLLHLHLFLADSFLIHTDNLNCKTYYKRVHALFTKRSTTQSPKQISISLFEKQSLRNLTSPVPWGILGVLQKKDKCHAVSGQQSPGDGPHMQESQWFLDPIKNSDRGWGNTETTPCSYKGVQPLWFYTLCQVEERCNSFRADFPKLYKGKFGGLGKWLPHWKPLASLLQDPAPTSDGSKPTPARWSDALFWHLWKPEHMSS